MDTKSDEFRDKELRKYLRRYTGQKSPFEKASLFSRITFTWLRPLMLITSQIGLTQDMYYEIRKQDRCSQIAEQMELQWKLSHPESQLSPGTKTPIGGILKTIWVPFRSEFWKIFFLQILLTVFEFLNIYLIYLAIFQVSLIDYKEENYLRSTPLLVTGALMLSFVLFNIGTVIISNYISFKFSLIGMNIRNGLSVLIYKKTMVRSLDSDPTYDLGDVTNLNQTDAHCFAILGSQVGFYASIPLKILVGVVGLCLVMGRSAAISFAVFLLIYCGNYCLGAAFKKFKQRQMSIADIKGRLLDEMFKNIRYLKLASLENYFLEKLAMLREEELEVIRLQYLRNNASHLFNLTAIAGFTICVFTLHIYFNGTLMLQDAFVTGMIFSLFQASFGALAPAVVNFVDCIVAAKRISFFLLSEEIDRSLFEHKRFSKIPYGKMISLKISRGNFYWVDSIKRDQYLGEKNRIGGLSTEEIKPLPKKSNDSSLKALTQPLKDESTSRIEGDASFNSQATILNLKDIELEIPAGACVGIIGKVGSGKSTLLAAIASELHHEPGSQIALLGELAYVTQTPWIPSKTIKDVILFGRDYDEARLKECIKSCALEEDLAQMPEGLETSLGDRGLNLSGGQKMRLSLARAFYSNRDIYLLDDPLSSLDVSVGKQVMEKGIFKYLKGKTRLLVTSALNYLPAFDYVVVLDGGRIVAKGTYQQIAETDIYKILSSSWSKEQSYLTNEIQLDQVSSKLSPNSVKLLPPVADLQSTSESIIEQIVMAEDKVQGSVITGKVINSYVSGLGGWTILFLAILCNLQ